MIPDRSTLNLAALALILVGNLWHFVWAVNVTSGFGHSERTLDRIRIALLVLLVGSTAWLGRHAFNQPIPAWPLPAQIYAAICILSGTVVGPLGSLMIRMRHQHNTIHHTSSSHDLADSHGKENLIGQTRNARLLRIPGNQSLHLRRVEWDLDFPGLPPALHGLSVIQLTDLHFARCYRREFFEAVVDACREWPADLVLITGDVVDDEETVAWIEPVLGRLTARLGKFAILGNHDYAHHAGSILHELNRAGFETLEGGWTTLDIEGATLAVGGTSAPWGPSFEPGDVPEADFRILLSHSPDQFPNARKWGMDFVLAGHNHGGQVRLPLIGPIFMPSKYSRRFDRGFFRSGPTLMYVSEGIGGKHPVRFGCKPEIARFVLHEVGHTPHLAAGRRFGADSVTR